MKAFMLIMSIAWGVFGAVVLLEGGSLTQGTTLIAISQMWLVGFNIVSKIEDNN